MIICKVSIYMMSIWAQSPRSAPLQHSPSLHMQSKGCSKVLYLGRGQHLGKGISHHVIHWAVDKANGTLLNDPANPVVLHVDVLCAQVVLVVVCECDGCLIVRE